MTHYFCPKCNRVTSKITDFEERKGKPCVICKTPTIPKYSWKDLDLFSNIKIKEKISHKGKVWIIHKHDKDCNFGSRHAHDYDNGLVLNLDNGEIKNIKIKKIINVIKQKELEAIKSKSRFFD